MIGFQYANAIWALLNTKKTTNPYIWTRDEDM